MSSSSPTAAPSPTSPPSPPSSPASPPSASPPSSNSTAPPPATTPAPSPSSTPPPAKPPETTPSPPSSPPPASSSPPSPATPSAPPPSRPSSPPPASSPPPSPNAGPPRSPPSSSPPPASNSPPSTPSTTPPPAPPRRSPPSSPSAPTGKAPPSGKTPPASPSPPSSSSSSVSTSLVVGVAVGAAVILVIFAILCLCCWRKKRHRSPPPPDYYGGVALPPPPPRKENPYGGRPQNWQQNAPLPADHVVKIPPQPTHLPPFASHPAHSSSSIETPRPPLPPPVINSSGGSGSNYSGSGTPLPPSPGLALGFSKSTFTYEEMSIATDGFSDANLLGQGGFGYVHKGMLPNGKEVAIKRLKSGSGQGEREFQAEVEIISRVHHKHLVSLIGYCISGDQRLLVYEYVPNNTLEFHLHGKDRPTMDWPTRLKIALGSAKGLAYLHEDCYPKIIHRDIKAANILLDYKFEPKVSDFGLAKFASDDNTHVSTRVMGTFGYLAPEYASSGKLTDKSDVFSFGVMLLEMITGRRPLSSTQSFMDDSLVDWARPLLTRALEEGNYDALIDPKVGKNYNPNEMACMIACAAACVRHSARRRPRMSQVVRALEGDVSLDDLNEGVRPGHSTAYASYGSSDYDSTQYNKDMKKFRKMALASQDRTVSGYSEPTSEYGLNPSSSSSEGQLTHEIELGSTKTDTHDS